VLGTLVTAAELEPSEPLALDCGSCRLCIDACPTDALAEAGTLDANRCLSWSTQRPGPIPEEHRVALDDRVYGCDVCQEVCPWNRGVEKRRVGGQAPGPATVDLVAWLEADGDELRAAYDRLYVPRNDARHLKRNALVALGNTGGPEHAATLARFAEGDDELLREHAEWALARLAERHGG
jgi:epoxyqueuosine reductase